MMTKEELEGYVVNKHFKLSENADKILNAVERCGGKCPCKPVEQVECPCDDHLKEIEDKGHCCCNLFVLRAE